MSNVDAAIAAIAASQHLLFSAPQARTAGASRALIHRRLRSGAWELAAHGVYRLPGWTPTSAHLRWLAHLAIGLRSVISHHTAALHYVSRGFPATPIHVTVPHSGYQAIPGIRVHQINDLADRGIVRVDGLPLTAPHRVPVDLAPHLGPKRLSDLVETLIVRKLVTGEEVGACLLRVARRGKPGVRRLGQVLDELAGATVPPHSDLELLFHRHWAAGGGPELIRQFPHPSPEFPTSRVDAAELASRVLIEVDSRSFHQRLADRTRDRERDLAAARLGWLTIRVGYEELVADPRRVIAHIIETIAARRAQLAG